MRALLAGVFAVALVAATPAGAATEVGANGNAFTGGLSFTPPAVTVAVGETVQWRNTDDFVPHTSTEVNDLWDLGGNYGQTPANPPGYAPGAVVGRAFEAGTHNYYCRVHPTDMTGTVAVPVTLSIKSKRVKRSRKARKRTGKRFKRVRSVVATWAPARPAEGLVFDVERQRGSGPWTPLLQGTRETSAVFAAGKRGTRWSVRARFKHGPGHGVEGATDWSPVASVSG
jgi:plastocyanin